MTTQVQPLMPMVTHCPNCERLRAENEALREIVQRLNEMDYALCAGNLAHEPIPHDVLARCLLRVRVGGDK